MKAIFFIAQKDLRLLLRDKGEVFFTFFFPVLLAIFFGFVFGGEGESSKIDLALVVESDSALAAGMARDLEADESFQVTRFPSRDAGIHSVRVGKSTAVVILPAAMQDGLGGLFSGDGIPIDAVVDPAHRAEAGLIQGKLNELAFRQFPKLLGDSTQSAKLFSSARTKLAEAKNLTPANRLAATGLIAAGEMFTKSLSTSERNTQADNSTAQQADSASSEESAWSPIAITMTELPPRTGRPRSSFDITVPQGAVWGLAGCISAFATAIVVERARGTLDRLRLAPITRMQMLAGKGIACFVTAMSVQALLIAMAVICFASSIAQPFMLMISCVASAFAFSGIAMMVAGLCRTEAQANGAGRGVILLLAMIGGGTIPVFLMPPFLKTMSFASPFRWAVTAMEGPFWRDTSLNEQLTPLLVLCVIGVAGFLIGTRAMGRSALRK